MSVKILKEALAALFSGRLGEISKIWVACSGGADSVALVRTAAEFIAAQKPAKLPEISILHFNHQLRGAESEADQAFVEKLGIELGYSVLVERILWKNGETRSQAAAREKRRLCLARLLGPTDVLLLGHHADDQAETLLFRLLRGTGLHGLQGMRIQRGMIWRPFLRIQRSQIRSALREWQQGWREDSSNQKNSYDRNWLRQEILPKLEARRPGVSRRLALLAEMIQEELAPARKLSIQVSPGKANLLSQEKLRNCSLFALSRVFSLESKGALALQKIAGKPEWRFSSKKYEFSCSQGLVLVTPRQWQEKRHKRQVGRSYIFRSELGVWRIISDSQICWRSELARGQGKILKKRAQKYSIPEFWREAIPLSQEAHYLWPVLENKAEHSEKVIEWRLGAQANSAAKIRFSPSRLARKWLKETRPSS